MSKTVCHIAPSHDRFDVRVFQKECKYLAKLYKVILVTADGKGDENLHGVSIRDLGSNYNSRIKKIVYNSYKAYKYSRKLNADIYHFHDPEFLLFALLLKIKGAIVVYDVHENYSLSILKKRWIKNRFFKLLFSKLWGALEKSISNNLNATVSVIESISQRFNSDSDIVVKNYPILSVFKEQEYQMTNKKIFKIIYTGTLVSFRNIHVLINLVELLNQTAGISCKLILAGKWHEREYEDYCRSLPGFKHTEFLGHINPERVYELLKSSHLGVNLISDNPNLKAGLPVKAFEFLISGIPTLLSDFSEWREVFGQNAFYANPDDLNVIAKTVKQIHDNYNYIQTFRETRIQFIKNNYSWDNEFEKLKELYTKLLTLHKI